MSETTSGVEDIVRNISGVAESALDSSRKTVETKDAAEELIAQAERIKDVLKALDEAK